MKVKLVHNDMRDTLGDPGFICRKCETTRKKHEDRMNCEIARQLSIDICDDITDGTMSSLKGLFG